MREDLTVKLDDMECLTTAGILATVETVGMDSVPGTKSACNGGWLTWMVGGTSGCGVRKSRG
jgi:hypothetical protein